MRVVEISNIEGPGSQIFVDNFPDTCPLCHYAIEARFVFGLYGEPVQIMFRCPRQGCDSLFIGYYRHSRNGETSYLYFLEAVQPRHNAEVVFSNEIVAVSKQFTLIYNHAVAAEAQGLTEICGCGYRRALEFLVKDFAIRERPADAAAIAGNTSLGGVIQTYIDDPRVKQMAKLATWLGNDATHYIKKHDDMSIRDLKMLIVLTVKWIESNELHNAYVKRLE